MGHYSYYLPYTQTKFGPDADQCEKIYQDFCSGFDIPNRYDGVSFLPDGRKVLIVKDFFADDSGQKKFGGLSPVRYLQHIF